MKKNLVVFFFLALIAWGQQEYNRSGFAPIPSTVTQWTQESEILALPVATRGQVKLASPPPVGLPDHLAIGSRAELRKYIVAKNNLEMNVWLTVQYSNNVNSLSQIQVGKWADGYDSFEEFLSDTTKGFQALTSRVMTATNYVKGDVWFEVAVSYLNGHSGIASPLGMSLTRKQGGRETLVISQIVDSFRSLEVNDFERLIVPIPALHQLEIEVTDGVGQVGTLTWVESNGVVKLASWPKPQGEPVTTLYFGMRGWLCDASYRVRVRLTPKQGDSETYTQYGDRLSIPTTVGISKDQGIQIIAPKGADVDILSSSNVTGSEWKFRGTFINFQGPTSSIPLGPDGSIQFYKAIAR